MRAAVACGMLAAGLVGAACEPPSPSLHIRFSGGPAQRCPSVDCSEIPAECSGVLSVRMLDPKVPNAPYLSQCSPLDETGNVCSIGGVDLEVTRPLPLQDLEVQVAVYPAHVLARDPMTGKPICPTDVRYSAVDGFPVEGAFTPALGGRTYYRPGDEEIVVVLGCTNLESINPPACEGSVSITVAASVDDFDTGVSVLPHEADRLSLYVGEPVADTIGGEYDLNLTGAPKLARSGSSASTPSWGGAIHAELRDLGCLAVFEDNPGTTTTVTCRSADLSSDWLSFTGRYAGARLSRSSLAQILAALSLSELPPQGLTIGIVLDANGDPVAGQVVSASAGATVRYLSSDRKFVVGGQTTGGEMGGVFVSTDAPLGTTFSTTSRGAPAETVSAIGGRIRGKVTIVVLRFVGNVVEPGGPPALGSG